MFEPVSTTTLGLWLSTAALQSYARCGSAVSPAAQRVRDAATEVVNLTERSEVLFGGKAKALSCLFSVANDCDQPNWGGNEEDPISPLAVHNAEAFLRGIPPDIPIPSIAPEPDGALSLDWIVSKDKMLSVSIGDSLRLAVAWVDGADNGHGVVSFNGSTVPQRILDNIRVMLPNESRIILAA